MPLLFLRIPPFPVRPPRRSIRASAAAIRLALASCLLVLVTAPPGRADAPPAGGKVLLVRGILTVFSLGLDDLARELAGEDVDVQVVPAAMATQAVERIGQQYADGQLSGPLVLIGHSLGGDLLPKLAQRLAAYDQTVDLMVMIDSTHPSDCPQNVLRCVNLYQSNSGPAWFRVLHGAPIRARNPATQLVNVDIRQLPEQDEAARLNHFNIEASKWIHRMVVREVLQVMQSPPAKPAEEVAVQVHDTLGAQPPAIAARAAPEGRGCGPNVLSVSSREAE